MQPGSYNEFILCCAEFGWLWSDGVLACWSDQENPILHYSDTPVLRLLSGNAFVF